MSSGRPKFENAMPVSGPGHRPQNLSASRRGPTIRHPPSNSSLSSQIPLSQGQVIALAREYMNKALEENIVKAAESSAVSNELKPGVTIDLSHKQIQKFPEEVVDIIKIELERYLYSFLSCRRLGVCLDLLDLPCCAVWLCLHYLRNRIHIDDHKANGTSCYRLALSHNQISTFPAKFAECTSLRYLNVRNNIIREFPLAVCEVTIL